MDAIERAIRSALENGDAGEKAFREDVYRKAFAALDRALKANPGITVEAAINRRKALQAKITAIESEHLSAASVRQASVPPPANSEDALFGWALEDDAGRSADPGLSAAMESGEATANLVPGPTVAAERDERRVASRRGRSALRLSLAVLFVAAIAAGVWFAYQTGLLVPPGWLQGADGTTSTSGQPETPPALSSQTEAERDWIVIYSPAGAAVPAAPGGASAEIQRDESGTFVRVRSGPDSAPMAFAVDPSVLQQIAGKTATFDIVARSPDPARTEIAVECRFGNATCDRRRFLVAFEHTDYLFEVDVPGAVSGAGTLSINSDFSRSGKAVDVYQIRVSVTP